jgi:glycerol-3-phosphate dehydrogenase
VRPQEVKWSYCGVRALIDDGEANPSEVSRDYRLRLDAPRGEAPLLSVFGGKITTYRRLAERALAQLSSFFPQMGAPWTAQAHLPGGELPQGTPDAFCTALSARYPALPPVLLCGLVSRHGARTEDVLGSAKTVDDLGTAFGAHLYAREIDYFVTHEWARCAEDVLWRRTKAGLHLTGEEQARVGAYVRRAAEGRMR